MPRLDDCATLMKDALAGDGKAYAELLRETARQLRPYLSKRLNQQADVEDVLQEILISIHKARHTYDGTRPYGPWMYAIANFRLKDRLRKHYADPLSRAAEIEVAENISANDVTESEFTYESISGEIAKLPTKQATILQLIHAQGYTAKQVAERMGMNESAVKVSAHRAYKILKQKLSGER